MFEVGFMELALIFVVALVVLGPTRLPGLVRQVGRWIGKARAVARDFQRQLEQEANLEELNKFTERTRQQASTETTPAPPPEFSGAAPPTDPAIHTEPDPPSMASSGYPYGTPAEPAAPAESSSAAAPGGPQPGDDTYSHAHAHDAAPAAGHEPVKPA